MIEIGPGCLPGSQGEQDYSRKICEMMKLRGLGCVSVTPMICRAPLPV
jgi:hypothetical protein